MAIPPSVFADTANQELLAEIRSVYERSQGTYGAVRVHQELRAQGHQVNRKRVARLMRTEGLVGVTRRRKRPRTHGGIPDAVPAEDLVQRDFTAAEPNWLGVRRFDVRCAQVLETSGMMLPKHEHVWNTFVLHQEGE